MAVRTAVTNRVDQVSVRPHGAVDQPEGHHPKQMTPARQPAIEIT
jgi:hypothetical protein